MIVDSSALIAMLRSEPEAERIHGILGRIGGAVSAATLVEARIVAQAKAGPQGVRRLAGLLRAYDIQVVPFDEQHADVATEAHQLYGRGSGHPARLNYGDAFSYALAYVRNEPLLYVGDDFSRTDIRSALEEYADDEDDADE